MSKAGAKAEQVGTDFSALKDLLIRTRKELKQAYRSQMGSMREYKPDSPAHNADEYEHTVDPDVVSFISNMRAEDIQRIDHAIRRIEDGTYGICVEPECSKPIPAKRLDAKPFALRCCECETEMEESKKSRSRITSSGWGTQRR